MREDLRKKLIQAVEKIDRPGSFCVSGSAPAVLPGLEVEGLGPVGLPLTVKQAKELIKQCHQAPYGKGEKTLVDTKVRRVWRMEPDRFSLTNPEWDRFVAETVGKVQEALGLEKQKLESHLYDLLIYEPKSFFLPHRDGEKLDRMVATLVIVLPSNYEGGELVVRHEGQEQAIDFRSGDGSPFHIHFAAFYADCEHEVRPLRKGYRLGLVYNLTLAKSKKGITAPRNTSSRSARSCAPGRRTTRSGSSPSRSTISTPRAGSPGMRSRAPIAPRRRCSWTPRGRRAATPTWRC
ncbi:MAG TPA: 2OG-Fe(II) oxygenase [Isosphaeraceae bacterium]